MNKIYFFFILITVVSCNKITSDKDFLEFTFEFRDKTDESYGVSDNSNSWIEEGKNINLKSYSNLFPDSIQSIINHTESKKLITLGRFSTITSTTNHELFLIKNNNNYTFIVGNKSSKRLTDFFIAPSDINLNQIRFEKSSKGRRILIQFTKRELKKDSDYKEDSYNVFDINYIIDKKGKIIFAEKEFNSFITFSELPETHQISGSYQGISEYHTASLSIKDKTLNDSIPFRLKIKDKRSKCIITYVDNLPIINNTIVKNMTAPDLYSLDFKKDKVDLYYSNCMDSVCYNGFCKLNLVLNKKR